MQTFDKVMVMILITGAAMLSVLSSMGYTDTKMCEAAGGKVVHGECIKKSCKIDLDKSKVRCEDSIPKICVLKDGKFDPRCNEKVE